MLHRVQCFKNNKTDFYETAKNNDSKITLMLHKLNCKERKKEFLNP